MGIALICLSVIKNGVNSLCWKKSVRYVYVYSMGAPHLNEVTAPVSGHPCIVIIFMKSDLIAFVTSILFSIIFQFG